MIIENFAEMAVSTETSVAPLAGVVEVTLRVTFTGGGSEDGVDVIN